MWSQRVRRRACTHRTSQLNIIESCGGAVCCLLSRRGREKGEPLQKVFDRPPAVYTVSSFPRLPRRTLRPLSARSCCEPFVRLSRALRTISSRVPASWKNMSVPRCSPIDRPVCAACALYHSCLSSPNFPRSKAQLDPVEPELRGGGESNTPWGALRRCRHSSSHLECSSSARALAASPRNQPELSHPDMRRNAHSTGERPTLVHVSVMASLATAINDKTVRPYSG